MALASPVRYSKGLSSLGETLLGCLAVVETGTAKLLTKGEDHSTAVVLLAGPLRIHRIGEVYMTYILPDSL